MAQRGESRGSRERAAERRIKAFELRKAGTRYRAIGNALGISEAQAHRDVAKVLQSLVLPEGEIKMARVLEEARLDAMLFALWGSANQGHLGTIDRVLRIMERRARLLGLDAPMKVSPTDVSGKHAYPAEELAELLRGVEESRALREKGHEPTL